MRPLAVLALCLALLPGPARPDAPVTVFAVNAPLAAMAGRLAGDRATVVFPVPQGRDPAFWRPGIAEIAAAQGADVILLNGAGYAAWTARATLPRGRIVDTSRAFADRLIETETVTHSHGAEGEHAHVGLAAHVWLDFALAAEQARAVAAALQRRMPEDRERIGAALAGLEADLAALDARARALGERIGGAALLASHPRYQYLARAYGLTVESLAWDPAETPDADAWAALDALAAETGATAMLWERAPTPETAAALAGRGIAVIVFEPGGDASPVPFLERMRANLDRLAAWAASDGRG